MGKFALRMRSLGMPSGLGALTAYLMLAGSPASATVISLDADGNYKVETAPTVPADAPTSDVSDSPPIPEADSRTYPLETTGTPDLPPDIAELVRVMENAPVPSSDEPQIARVVTEGGPAPSAAAVGGFQKFAPDATLDPSTLDMLITPHLDLHPELDRHLVQAVIRVESAGRVDAVSHKGAMGLMQLMPATAERLGVKDAFDPAENVRGGMSELARLLENHSELPLVLAAYNAGEGAVAEYGGIPPFPETQGYVVKVLRHINQTQTAEIAALREGNLVALSQLGLARAHLPGSAAKTSGIRNDTSGREAPRDTGPLLVSLEPAGAPNSSGMD